MKRAPDSDIERRYHDIFEHTPLGLWDEDYTEVARAIEAMKASGVRDFERHFAEHPEIVAELARSVKIRDVNRACLDVFGARTKEDLLGRLDGVFCEESLHIFRDQLVLMAQGGRVFSSEARARTLDGRPLYVWFTLTLLPQEDGSVRGLVSTLDISQRRQMENALRASEERYADLYDHAPDMFASLDPRSGVIVQCNQTMAAHIGCTKAEIVGRSMAEVIHPRFAADIEATLARLQSADTVECPHVQLLARTGRVIDTSLKISVVRDDGGDVLWHSAVWRDIGKQKQAENELADREELYRTLTESIPHLIWMGDAHGRITYCNQTMCDITGITLAGMRGRDWTDMVHSEDRAEIEALQEVARWSGVQYRGECRLQGAEGSDRTVSFIVTPVKDGEGDVTHWVGINTDITGLKKAQHGLQRALERSNMELAQIAYAASHDLQEPLRMVTSYVQLLARRYAGRLDERADKYISYAIQGAKRIRRLIRDLLMLSQIGMEDKELQPIDCDRCLAQVGVGLRREIAASEAEIVYETPMPAIMGDISQVMLLFRCLLSNSIKFRDQAPPRISISARRDGTMWLFAVKDNGIGFESAYRDRIFQMFQRLHPRGVYTGTGIGLTLAKKIVERHGGRMWADSTPAQGATFYFTLPAVGVELVDKTDRGRS